MLHKIGLEMYVLLLNGVLSNMRQAEYRQEGSEDTEGAADEKWVLSLLDRIVTSSCNDVREDVVADECSHFTDGCCDAIVLASDSRR